VLAGGGAWLLTAADGPVSRAAGLGLIAGPLLFLAYRTIAQSIIIAGLLWRTHLSRSWALAGAVDALLTVLCEIRDPAARSRMPDRDRWAHAIEQAAALIERELATALGGYDPQTRQVTAAHCRGAARALRDLKRDVAMPSAGSWERVEAELVHAFTALADGDLGELRTAEEPPREQLPRSRWSRTAAALRAVLVAAVPVATVVALQPVLDLAKEHYHWAKVGAAGWALVYLLISVDPTMREKFEVVSDLVSLARGEPRRDQAESPAQTPSVR